MIENIEKLSEEELVSLIGRWGPSPTGGNDLRQAQAELTRRHIVELRKSSAATERHNSKMFDLTMVLFAVAVLQIWTTVFSSDKPTWFQAGLMALAVVFLIFIIKDILNYKKERKAK